MSKNREIEHLRDRLLDKQVEWPPESHRSFIPIDQINDLVNYQNVRQVLSPELSSEFLDEYTSLICSSARRLFAIFILIREIKCVISLIELLDEEVTDGDLPFTRIYTNTTGSRTGNGKYKLGRKNHPSCPLLNHDDCHIRSISSWKPSHVKILCRDQWQALAPVFEGEHGSINHYKLDKNTILPFTEDQEEESDKVKTGGFSEVWGVRIHQAHQTLLPPLGSDGPFFAVKRLNSRDPKVFEREFEMLRDLTLHYHPHLVELLATYNFHDKYHLLFPYADYDLRRYWQSIDLPEWRRGQVLWALEQMKGLTSGLNVIHNFTPKQLLGSDVPDPNVTRQKPSIYRLRVHEGEERFGRHGDIKPENILCVFNSGRDMLQITDLGLGRFHGLESRSKSNPTGVSPTYASPEVSLDKPVSRMYDIWSMGCVFLEFITWLLEGSEGLKEFHSGRLEKALDGIEDDTFYSIKDRRGSKYAIVRPKVAAWISHLRRSRRCSQMASEVLGLVHNGMLQIESKFRITANQLENELKIILDKAEKDATYLLG